ncbi:hypothetical protein CBR_g22953 [Chara braunii]|uniref:DNA topoisomerase n=1 Tax=Chara braunii TaxID=69332 RepID=A0A388L351_CHABU|nr:hypothetical protein CBR_g22953 [Chara braunii]|eukprot:GBG76735.1 hypothetical protein CBR_g22953 [Chara braunii]
MASLVKSWISGTSTAQAVCGSSKSSSNTCHTSRVVAREYRRAVSSLPFANKVVRTTTCRNPGASGLGGSGWKQCRAECPPHRDVVPSGARRSRCGVLRGRFITVCGNKAGGCSECRRSSNISINSVAGTTWSLLGASLRGARGTSLLSVRQWDLFSVGRTRVLVGGGASSSSCNSSDAVSENRLRCESAVVVRPRCGGKDGSWGAERQDSSPSSLSSRRLHVASSSAGVVAAPQSALEEGSPSYAGVEAVLVVESPAKAKTIQKYLGDSFIVLPTFGHVREVAKSADAIRPGDGFAIDWVNKPWKHLNELQKLLGMVDRLVLATDPDREGEAISWHVVEMLKASGALRSDLQIQRVTFYEITKRAVLEAVKNPRDVSQELVSAYLARCALDYLMGYGLSPVLWRKVPGSKSAGRVQSVSLRMVCEREEEIMTFVPHEYWTVEALVESGDGSVFPAKLTHLHGEKLELSAGGAGGGGGRRIASEEEAKAAVELIAASDLRVSSVKTQQVRRNPPPPYTTSTLQQDASAKLGFSATKTITIAQKLYEGVNMGKGESSGLVTYIRTDGVQVSAEAVQDIRSYLEAKYGPAYVPEKPRVFKMKLKNAQEAHEAIRPTNFEMNPSALVSVLDKDALKLYTMIWKRAVASQAEASLHEQVAIDIDSVKGGGGEVEARLRATGSRLLFPGFLATYSDHGGASKEGKQSPEEEEEVPELKEGESLSQKKVDPIQHFTRPPNRFTEGTLIRKLEEAGIGRPSTYATIMKVLRTRNYVNVEQGKLVPTSRGLLVSSFLSNYFQRYVDYGFTAALESQLDDVSAGQVGYRDVLSSFWTPFDENVSETMKIPLAEVLGKLEEVMDDLLFRPPPPPAAALSSDGPADRATDSSIAEEAGQSVDDQRRRCPKCSEGKLMLRLSTFGAFLGCSRYPECTHVGTIKAFTEGAEFEQRVLGVDPQSGLQVTCRKGPFGFYVQRSRSTSQDKETPAAAAKDDPAESDDKGLVKRVPLGKLFRPEDITLEGALLLLDCPRKLGESPEDGSAVMLCIGKYGLYVEKGETKVRVPRETDPVSVTLDEALMILKAKDTAEAKLARKRGRPRKKLLNRSLKGEEAGAGEEEEEEVDGVTGRRKRGKRLKTRRVRTPNPSGTPRVTGLTKPLPLSPALSRFLGGETMMSRADVIKRIWVYIKEKQLQDTKDLKLVKFDATLKTLFGADESNAFHIAKLLKPHFVQEVVVDSSSSSQQQVEEAEQLIPSRS